MLQLQSFSRTKLIYYFYDDFEKHLKNNLSSKDWSVACMHSYLLHPWLAAIRPHMRLFYRTCLLFTVDSNTCSRYGGNHKLHLSSIGLC